jgi:hypothetical protein
MELNIRELYTNTLFSLRNGIGCALLRAGDLEYLADLCELSRYLNIPASKICPIFDSVAETCLRLNLNDVPGLTEVDGLSEQDRDNSKKNLEQIRETYELCIHSAMLGKDFNYKEFEEHLSSLEAIYRIGQTTSPEAIA